MKKKNKKSNRIAYLDGKFVSYEETDFWRRGFMKKIPVLAGLSFVMLIGIVLTVFVK